VAVPVWLTIISWIFISIGLLSAALILADIYPLGPAPRNCWADQLGCWRAGSVQPGP
jgi:hypothetical protein